MIPILSITLATLFVGTLATFAAGTRARYVAAAVSAIFLAEIAAMFGLFAAPVLGFALPTQFAEPESYPWIQVAWLHVNYTIGIDGISLVLILLTGILQAVTVAYSWTEQRQPAAWFGLVLLTCLGCFGVFVALDVLLFFVFWEVVLVPMFF
ncbi:MAG: dehydrogenase, partial [Thermoplasmata archaeon]|nr:dehydrogenase [Thermoplasmata archaeon]